MPSTIRERNLRFISDFAIFRIEELCFFCFGVGVVLKDYRFLFGMLGGFEVLCWLENVFLIL